MSQLVHAALFLAMSFCIPGQYTLPMALAVIPVMPWWAACSTSRASAWREEGMITLSPYNTTGPMVDSSDLDLKYSLVFSGQLSLLSRIPLLMMSTRVVMTVSWAEWVSSLSHDMTCLFWDMQWMV